MIVNDDEGKAKSLILMLANLIMLRRQNHTDCVRCSHYSEQFFSLSVSSSLVSLDQKDLPL